MFYSFLKLTDQTFQIVSLKNRHTYGPHGLEHISFNMILILK